MLTKMITVDGRQIKITTRRRSYRGSPVGYMTTVTAEGQEPKHYHELTLDAQAAMDKGFARYVKGQ